jgi:hypothetical protein
MTAVFLEVMDKEPWVWDIWYICLPIAFIGFFLCRYSVWFIAVILFLTVPLLFYALPEIGDPLIRSAILRESGGYYFIRLFALLLVIFLSTTGAILNVKNQRKRIST